VNGKKDRNSKGKTIPEQKFISFFMPTPQTVYKIIGNVMIIYTAAHHIKTSDRPV
jgi:hypothetical protein